ncbi:MAG: hypothetical protein COT26_00285 [Candidatus Kerfeldbacteria bacterium CG08_land_8_20_14_0_20_43_14]|uniref:Uncharacterized protein n=1 Tax=Candidatus Kerfeldbacteria bacterium CG08_land_8_20_14_0_20_43_14 TaxID=2014246 RepID=A0A2H0YRA4_9BACT|nr:MAG: hypothetical protein COT26_00285 [Candidatus Kerfeldbacteria bacterium CG08_land_8_20_14_0_20_43_14]
MLQEIFAWLMLFLKWEVSVGAWKAIGRPYWYVVAACFIHGFFFIGTIWGLFSGIIRLIRWLARKVRNFFRKRKLWPRCFPRGPWNGKTNGKPKKTSSLQAKAHNFATWLANNRFGVTMCYLLIYAISAMPVLPLTEYVAIIFGKLTKTKGAFWIIMAGILTKILITTWAIYYQI